MIIEEAREIVWEINENGFGWAGGNKIGWIFNTNNDVGETLGLLINSIIAKEKRIAELIDDRNFHHFTPIRQFHLVENSQMAATSYEFF